MIKSAVEPHKSPDQLAATLRQMPLRGSLRDNLAELQEIFSRCSDLVIHEIAPESGPGQCVLYVDGLVNTELVDRDIVQPLIRTQSPPDPRRIAARLTAVSETNVLHTFGDVVYGVLSGDAVLLIDGAPAAVGYSVRRWQSRSVEEPTTEAVIRGPREGFVETLRFNTAMLRRKIKSPSLKVESLKIGRITQTDLAVVYIEGIANPEVVREIFRRLERIDVDGVLEGGDIEQLIEDSPFSPFPQVQNTERPDTAAANLLEGRILILVDGTPFALIVPVLFTQFLQAAEDYYERFLIGTVVRGLRFTFLLVALLLPSLYIAIITYHQEMLPTPLLLSIAAAREGIPFPALVEALIMEITFEILREAGVRLPRPVGQAVSIVGALVIGEAAVRAGFVSATMVIVVSITGIASFAIPKYNAGIAVRMLRFPLMLLAGSLGLFGVMGGLTCILLHLCSLRSLGIPYLTPVAPLNWQGLKDTLLRAPLWWMRQRPRLIGHANPIRRRPGLRPGAHQGPGRRQ